MAYKNTRGYEVFPRLDNNSIGTYSFFSYSGFLDLGFEFANGNPYEIRIANEIDEHYRLIVSKTIKDHYTSAAAKSYFISLEGQKISLPAKFLPSQTLLEKRRNLLVG